MRITILGTAAIGYPLAFCNCENCKSARIRKGKSIRKSSSILINDDLIIDLGPDTQTAMNMYDKDMGNIRYLLQTHSHTDHYDEDLLCTRIPYMVAKEHNKLEIYAHQNCLNINIKFIEQIKKLREINCINDNTKIYGTHISHDGMSYHEEIEKRAISNGYNIAYDGMEIEI